jgi:hypothetical protein
MSVRAKFKVSSIVDGKDANGVVATRQVHLQAVYSPDQDHPNYSWSKWTPCGSLSMTITNPTPSISSRRGRNTSSTLPQHKRITDMNSIQH